MKEEHWVAYRMREVIPLMLSHIEMKAEAQQNSGVTLIQMSYRQYMSNRLNWKLACLDADSLGISLEELRIRKKERAKRQHQFIRYWEKMVKKENISWIKRVWKFAGWLLYHNLMWRK